MRTVTYGSACILDAFVTGPVDTLETDPGGVHLVRRDAGEFVQELKDRPGKGICVMGGGELARSLFAAGVIDEVGLNVHPVLLGSGVPLFRDGARIRLALAECNVIDGGCVLSTYRVVHDTVAEARPRRAKATRGRATTT